MVTLELHQLALRYPQLRIADPGRRARLEQAIAQQGQQVPVLVVPIGDGRFVLIDGYARVAALRRLGRDEVLAVALDVDEAEALVLRHRLEAARTRSALEDGWLVAVLLDQGRAQEDIAVALGKSAAWVSRRLALVRTLPDSVQEAVRAGRIGSNAAEKFLVPLSRVNAAQCAALVEGLRSVRPSLRQLGRLYAAWKAADADVRQQIADRPLLYLKAEEATQADPDEDLTALRGVEAVAASCGRARRDLREGALARLAVERRPQLASAWTEARLAFEALERLLEEEGVRARP